MSPRSSSPPEVLTGPGRVGSLICREVSDGKTVWVERWDGKAWVKSGLNVSEMFSDDVTPAPEPELMDRPGIPLEDREAPAP